MTKSQLLKALEGLPDDAEIALWRYDDQRGSFVTELMPTLNNPAIATEGNSPEFIKPGTKVFLLGTSGFEIKTVRGE